MRIVFVDQQCWLWNTSGLVRYLAEQADVELIYMADLVEFGPVWEADRSKYPNTIFEEFRAWHDGPLQSNNGYQDQCVEWKHLEERYRQHYSDPPDLIMVQETTFMPWGDKTIFEGVPCVFLCEDAPRGIDHILRASKAMGASDIVVPSKHWASTCSMREHRYPDTAPAGQVSAAVNSGMFFAPEHIHVIPVCADPFWFNEPNASLATEQEKLKILWGGNDSLVKEDGSHVDLTQQVRHIGASHVQTIDSMGTPDKFTREYGEYHQRSRLIWYLFNDSEVPFEILYPPQFGADYASTIKSSQIGWNCQGGWEASHYAESYRIWQITACGTCLVTNETDSIGDSFKIGEEVITYKLYYHPDHHLFEWFDYQELKNTLMELLGDENRRREIGHAAAERTRKDHLPEHRFHSICAALEIPL